MFETIFNKKPGTGAIRQEVLDPSIKQWVPDFAATAYPDSVDWSSLLPKPWNQNPFNTCEAHATTLAAINFLTRFKGVPYFMPSRAFSNWNARVVSKRKLGVDDGCSSTDVLNGLMASGLAEERYYDYSAGHIKDTFWGLKKISGPGADAYKSGAKHKVLAYSSLVHQRSAADPNIYDIEVFKQCLAQGHTFCAGVVYWDFKSVNGLIPIPPKEMWGKIFDGHAVCIVGFDEQGLIFRNSWGPWGAKLAGNGKLPWAFVQNPSLFFDAYVITDMS